MRLDGDHPPAAADEAGGEQCIGPDIRADVEEGVPRAQLVPQPGDGTGLLDEEAGGPPYRFQRAAHEAVALSIVAPDDDADAAAETQAVFQQLAHESGRTRPAVGEDLNGFSSYRARLMARVSPWTEAQA